MYLCGHEILYFKKPFCKMKFILTTLFLIIAATAMPQILVNGHEACYDSISSTWLSTIPDTMFNKDCMLTVSMDSSCQQVVIGKDTVQISQSQTSFNHLFENICSDSLYTIVVTNTLGQINEGHIQFTFLPIIQLMGTFGYVYQGGTVMIADPSLDTDSIFTATVKWRGGLTNNANKHKRNYKIKFDHDVKLFGLRSDNNWMLDAGQTDVFRMRNRIAMDIWNDIASRPYHSDEKPNARNGVRGLMVEVFLNHEYRGIYNFSELIDRKQLKLKKIDEDTGEIHGCLYKGLDWNHTQMFDLLDNYDNNKETLYGIEVKYPNLNDADTTDWAPYFNANNYAIECSDEAFEQNISDYFDIPVLVDYSLLVSVVNALDNSGKNMYWAIYDKATTKRLTPTPWDLDITFGQRWGGILVNPENDHTSPSYFTDVDVFIFFRLYKGNVLQFNDRLNQRYQSLRQAGEPLSTDSLISRVTQYYQAMKKSGAARRETAKWSGDSDVWGDTIDFDSEYEYICNWITQHMAIIDDTTFPLYYNKQFFNEINIVHQPTVTPFNSSIYDLTGRQITNSKMIKGIYIQLYYGKPKKIIKQ